MKESGINHFLNKIGFDSGLFKVLYTFEEGTGTQINSISGGQSYYTGTIAGGVNDFWIKPGSGFFSGNNVDIANASGLYSTNFTHIFSFEKTNNEDSLLLSTLINGSGYNIGITPTNKIYFETYNDAPVVAANLNNLGSKNLISVSYLTNSLSIGYYNYNAQSFEIESFNYPFGNPRSDIWNLGKTFTGYLDYYLYFSRYINASVLNSIASGFFNRPTGVSFQFETICTSGITGYSGILISETGVTGYITSGAGGDGLGDFGEAFPNETQSVALTGIISTGILYSGITGLQCITYTGSKIDLYESFTGYGSSFGMEKILLLQFVDTGSDILKYSNSKTPLDNNYNKPGVSVATGFNLGNFYTTGQLNVFLNGLATSNSGNSLSGLFLTISGSLTEDIVFFDLKSGSKISDNSSPYEIVYSGQEIFLNGLNLVSGYDFITTGNFLFLTGQNTGIAGDVFEHPIVLTYETGNFSIKTGEKFMRNTSNLYLNGLRQQNKVDYIEGATYDRLSNNFYDDFNVDTIYDNNNRFWE